jgi:hypothetical protein
MADQPIRQYPDERREQAEADMLRIHPPAICELPHETTAEEEEREQQRLGNLTPTEA